LRSPAYLLPILAILASAMAPPSSAAPANLRPVPPPPLQAPIPLENRAGGIGEGAASTGTSATLSGTLIRRSLATTSWFLYPGACTDRANGIWAPRSVPQADSLNTYAIGSTGGYSRLDQTIKPQLWHVVDAATPSGQRPAIPNGSRALWCGKYDPNWVVPVGYPNLTEQILYIDLESDRAPIAASGTYTITFTMNQSTELGYDFVYFIGGGDSGDGFGDEDPLLNDRTAFDEVRATGSYAAARLQATFTGNINPTTPGVGTPILGANAPNIVGDGFAQPSNTPITFKMSTANRAFYVLFTSDCLFSNEDGFWPFGHGLIYDDLKVTDTISGTLRTIYDEGLPAGGTDAVGGAIIASAPITATETDGVKISARTFPGQGAFWAIQDGGTYTTSDICAQNKNAAGDRFFLGVDPVTKSAIPGQYNSVVTCTLPVPSGTADVTALWGEYLNLPRTSGYVQYAEYRYFKGGTWSNWENTSASGSVRTSIVDQWLVDGDPLPKAVQADSVQLRYNIACIVAFSSTSTCGANVDYVVLYDDLQLRLTAGAGVPVASVFVGSVAQTTFVDGTMTGLNCSATPCWPGVRGTDLQFNPNPDVSRRAVRDNVNSPLGDSITFAASTGLRDHGMGINWHLGYDKSVDGGRTIARSNGAFNPTFGAPQVIYRLYDPATATWSPWDSTEADADNVSVNPTGPDTTVIESGYRLTWPPRSKIGFNLPGGFTINGQGAYANLAFLPRGTRLQYYFKAVDILGGVSYLFSTDALAREVADLPTLPGSAVVAPDIIEFDVLPRKYPAGLAGTLLAGKTSTPILNLDGSYTGWSFQQDPVTAALRGLGVRADRYRYLQGLGEGNNIGGHELTGDRPERLSNFFPNREEYGIVDSLASWYRILIQSSHLRTVTVFNEQDAQVVSDWARATTGSNGGDRCLLLTGDDAFNALTNLPSGTNGVRQLALSRDIFGVANVVTLALSAEKGAWAGANTASYPTIDDRFAAAGSGPGLAAPGSFLYEADGGCPGANRFDPLTAQSLPQTTAAASATYPIAAGVTDVAAVATTGEWDAVPDLDRTKALGYGFSIQFIRGSPGVIPRNAANYVHSGAQNRMQVLYKFLTGCRDARAGGSTCWPCPADANMTGNWASLTGFQVETYGPLYPMQDPSQATPVLEGETLPPAANRVYGNAPNPFNPQTTISFTAATSGRITIRIFDVAGRLVRSLDTKLAHPGRATVRWDGVDGRGARCASGVYFYRVTFPDGHAERGPRGMTLLK
jgi:hypothetical protein